jgi:hypothetical protein
LGNARLLGKTCPMAPILDPFLACHGSELGQDFRPVMDPK